MVGLWPYGPWVAQLALSGSGSAWTMAFTQASWGHLVPSLPRMSTWDNLQPEKKGYGRFSTRGHAGMSIFINPNCGYDLWKFTIKVLDLDIYNNLVR
jgi:hypothetical protein